MGEGFYNHCMNTIFVPQTGSAVVRSTWNAFDRFMKQTESHSSVFPQLCGD